MPRYFYDTMTRDVDSRRYIVLYRENSLAAFILYADFYSFSAGDITALCARIMRFATGSMKGRGIFMTRR